jgi:hypothetical protein
MVIADEEARAKQFQEDEAARCAARRERAALLAGDPAAQRELVDAWQPVRLWLRDRRRRDVRHDDEEC